MSGTDHVERIEERLASGKGLLPADIEHARTCAVCAATIAATARLDADLEAAARSIISEPMPPIEQLLAAAERSPRRNAWGVARMFANAAGTAVVVLLAVIAGLVGLNLWQGAGGGSVPPPTPSATPTPTVRPLPADMEGWVEAAGASIWTHSDRIGPVPAMVLVQLERCGDSALAFFEDPSPSPGDPLLFGVGSYRVAPYEADFGGQASSVDDPEAAYARSQMPPCTVLVDTTLSADQALAAYLRSAAHATDPHVVATKLVTADVGLAYVDELQNGASHQQVLVLRREGDRWTVTGAQGGEYPASIASSLGVTPMGVAKGMPDNRWVAVGVPPNHEPQIVAVEITFDGVIHRYPVAGKGFVILLPENVGLSLPYDFIDANGIKVEIATSLP